LGAHTSCSFTIIVAGHLLRCTSVCWQIKSNTPVPDDIAEQGIPAGHAPAVRDINELLVELQELQNLEPICK